MYDSAFDPYNQISHDMAFSSSLLGKECQSCRRAPDLYFLDKDSTSRDGQGFNLPKM